MYNISLSSNLPRDIEFKAMTAERNHGRVAGAHRHDSHAHARRLVSRTCCESRVISSRLYATRCKHIRARAQVSRGDERKRAMLHMGTRTHACARVSRGAHVLNCGARLRCKRALRRRERTSVSFARVFPPEEVSRISRVRSDESNNE